jgi:hypothetical protein
MKTAQFKSLGLAVNLSVPSTVQEFDTNAKREGACLEEATNNIVYRSCLAELRDLFLHGCDEDKEAGITAFTGVEQTYKVERKTKGTGRKDSEGKEIVVYAETEAEYLERVRREKKLELTVLQPLMDKAAARVKFDAAARERKPAAPKKLAAKYKESAEAVLKGPHLKRFVADVDKALGKKFVATGDAAKDVEALGWLVKEFLAWKEEQNRLALTS